MRLDNEALFKALRTETVPAEALRVGDIVLILGGTVILIEKVEQPENDGRGGVVVNNLNGRQRRLRGMVPRIDRKALRQPPVDTTWDDFQAKLEAVEAMQARVEDLRTHHHGMHWAFEAKKLVEQREGFCERCCLPLGAKHADHNPEFEVTEGDHVTVLSRPRNNHQEDIAPAMKARREAYQRAIRSLNDGELMAMPIPYAPVHTHVLTAELRERIPRHRRRTRYDLLIGDDGDA